jgi:hypothetical protein
MTEAGLDPGGNYSLNDKDESITPAETSPITKMWFGAGATNGRPDDLRPTLGAKTAPRGCNAA